MKYLNIKYPSGAVSRRLSVRSKMPPMPGMIVPESLTSACRLKADSTRSDAIEAMPIGIAISAERHQVKSSGGIGIKDAKNEEADEHGKDDAASGAFEGLFRADHREGRFADLHPDE